MKISIKHMEKTHQLIFTFPTTTGLDHYSPYLFFSCIYRPTKSKPNTFMERSTNNQPITTQGTQLHNPISKQNPKK